MTNTVAICPAHTISTPTQFEIAAIERGHNWICTACGAASHATELVWEDPFVPSCPCCQAMDTMQESR